MSAQIDIFGVEPERDTERTMLDRLNCRYGGRITNGNWEGPKFFRAEHVPIGLGWNRTRICDFIAVDMHSATSGPDVSYHSDDYWSIRPPIFHGHEVKVSRSDWLTELRDPSKAETFKRHCDFWWLAVSDAAIVREDLPADWGLIVMAGDTMRIRKQAPRRAFPAPMEVDMRAALERSIAKTARRHLVLDIERGRRQACERYVSPGTCLRVPNAPPCWTCRAALLAQTTAPNQEEA